MKKVILSLFLTFLTVLLFAQVHVKGYYRKDGTYVQPHVRSSPDGNPYNNYSYPGNTNPYTGKVATGNPDTYLNNYYKRAVSEGNSSAAIYLKDSRGVNTGEYLQYLFKADKCVTYGVYDKTNNYTGFLEVYDDGNVKLFDKYKKPINSSEPSTSVVQVQQPSPPIINYEDPNLQTENEKVYLKDKNGNYTGYYTVLEDENEVRKKFKLYDSIDNFEGTLVQFKNGEVFIYNFAGTLIKHTIPSSKKTKAKSNKP